MDFHNIHPLYKTYPGKKEPADLSTIKNPSTSFNSLRQKANTDEKSPIS